MATSYMAGQGFTLGTCKARLSTPPLGLNAGKKALVTSPLLGQRVCIAPRPSTCRLGPFLPPRIITTAPRGRTTGIRASAASFGAAANRRPSTPGDKKEGAQPDLLDKTNAAVLKWLSVPAAFLAAVAITLDGKGLLIAMYFAVRYVLPGAMAGLAAYKAGQVAGPSAPAVVMGCVAAFTAAFNKIDPMVWDAANLTRVNMKYPVFTGVVRLPTKAVAFVQKHAVSGDIAYELVTIATTFLAATFGALLVANLARTASRVMARIIHAQAAKLQTAILPKMPKLPKLPDARAWPKAMQDFYLYNLLDKEREKDKTPEEDIVWAPDGERLDSLHYRAGRGWKNYAVADVAAFDAFITAKSLKAARQAYADNRQAWPRLQCQLYDFNSELLKNLRGQHSMERLQAAEIEKLKEKLGEVEGRERDLEARLRGARKVSSELGRDNSIKQDILTNSQTVTKGLEIKLHEAETKLREAEAKLREAEKNRAETERLRSGEVVKSQDLIRSLQSKLEKAKIDRADVEGLLTEAANAQAVAKNFEGRLEAAKKEKKDLEERLEKATESLVSVSSQKAELQRSLKVALASVNSLEEVLRAEEEALLSDGLNLETLRTKRGSAPRKGNQTKSRLQADFDAIMESHHSLAKTLRTTKAQLATAQQQAMDAKRAQDKAAQKAGQKQQKPESDTLVSLREARETLAAGVRDAEERLANAVASAISANAVNAEKVAGLEAKIAAMKEDAATSAAELAKAMAEVERLTGEKAEVEKLLTKVELLKQANADFKDQSAEIERLTEEKEDLEAELQEMTEEKERLEAELEGATIERDDGILALEQLQEEFDIHREETESEIYGHTSDREILERKLEDLGDELDGALEAKEEALEKMEQHYTDLLDAKDRLKEARAQVVELQAEAESLKAPGKVSPPEGDEKELLERVAREAALQAGGTFMTDSEFAKAAILTGEMTTLVDEVTELPTAKFVKLAEGDLARQGAALLAAKAKLADDRDALRTANVQLDYDRAALLAEKAEMEREKLAMRVGKLDVAGMDAEQKTVHASLLEVKADLDADRADLDRERAAFDMNRAALLADRAKLDKQQDVMLKVWLGLDVGTAGLELLQELTEEDVWPKARVEAKTDGYMSPILELINAKFPTGNGDVAKAPEDQSPADAVTAETTAETPASVEAVVDSSPHTAEPEVDLDAGRVVMTWLDATPTPVGTPEGSQEDAAPGNPKLFPATLEAPVPDSNLVQGDEGAPAAQEEKRYWLDLPYDDDDKSAVLDSMPLISGPKEGPREGDEVITVSWEKPAGPPGQNVPITADGDNSHNISAPAAPPPEFFIEDPKGAPDAGPVAPEGGAEDPEGEGDRFKGGFVLVDRVKDADGRSVSVYEAVPPGAAKGAIPKRYTGTVDDGTPATTLNPSRLFRVRDKDDEEISPKDVAADGPVGPLQGREIDLGMEMTLELDHECVVRVRAFLPPDFSEEALDGARPDGGPPGEVDLDAGRVVLGDHDVNPSGAAAADIANPESRVLSDGANPESRVPKDAVAGKLKPKSEQGKGADAEVDLDAGRRVIHETLESNQVGAAASDAANPPSRVSLEDIKGKPEAVEERFSGEVDLDAGHVVLPDEKTENPNSFLGTSVEPRTTLAAKPERPKEEISEAEGACEAVQGKNPGAQEENLVAETKTRESAGAWRGPWKGSKAADGGALWWPESWYEELPAAVPKGEIIDGKEPSFAEFVGVLRKYAAGPSAPNATKFDTDEYLESFASNFPSPANLPETAQTRATLLAKCAEAAFADPPLPKADVDIILKAGFQALLQAEVNDKKRRQKRTQDPWTLFVERVGAGSPTALRALIDRTILRTPLPTIDWEDSSVSYHGLFTNQRDGLKTEVEKNADTASVLSEFNLLCNEADDENDEEEFISFDTPFSLYDGFPEDLGEGPKGVSPLSREELGEGDGEGKSFEEAPEHAARRLRWARASATTPSSFPGWMKTKRSYPGMVSSRDPPKAETTRAVRRSLPGWATLRPPTSAPKPSNPTEDDKADEFDVPVEVEGKAPSVERTIEVVDGDRPSSAKAEGLNKENPRYAAGSAVEGGLTSLMKDSVPMQLEFQPPALSPLSTEGETKQAAVSAETDVKEAAPPLSPPSAESKTEAAPLSVESETKKASVSAETDGKGTTPTPSPPSAESEAKALKTSRLIDIAFEEPLNELAVKAEDTISAPAPSVASLVVEENKNVAKEGAETAKEGVETAKEGVETPKEGVKASTEVAQDTAPSKGLNTENPSYAAGSAVNGGLEALRGAFNSHMEESQIPLSERAQGPYDRYLEEKKMRHEEARDRFTRAGRKEVSSYEVMITDADEDEDADVDPVAKQPAQKRLFTVVPRAFKEGNVEVTRDVPILESPPEDLPSPLADGLADDDEGQSPGLYRMRFRF